MNHRSRNFQNLVKSALKNVVLGPMSHRHFSRLASSGVLFPLHILPYLPSIYEEGIGEKENRSGKGGRKIRLLLHEQPLPSPSSPSPATLP